MNGLSFETKTDAEGKSMEIKTGIMFIIFSDFLMVDHIFLSPQVKRIVIINNKMVYTSC